MRGICWSSHRHLSVCCRSVSQSFRFCWLLLNVIGNAVVCLCLLSISSLSLFFSYRRSPSLAGCWWHRLEAPRMFQERESVSAPLLSLTLLRAIWYRRALFFFLSVTVQQRSTVLTCLPDSPVPRTAHSPGPFPPTQHKYQDILDRVLGYQDTGLLGRPPYRQPSTL
jgi:hypothetical protein